jgi:hypothetical protein
MKVNGKLLFILDTESNVHIFDLIRQGFTRNHDKQQEAQSN